MPAKVLVVWLDGAEITLLDAMMARGELPNLRAVRESGTHGRLRGLEHTIAETAYGFVLTGQPPEKTGTWCIGKFDPETYRESDHPQATGFCGWQTFPELCSHLRTCLFDVPSLPLVPNLNGVQVASWGGHSPKVPAGSNPPELLPELVAKYGDHPGAVYRDHACLYDAAAMHDLRDRILTGIPRRGDIACDLLGRDDWDLFFTTFGEPHGAGHVFWPNPACRHLLEASGTLDTVETVYRAIDHELGRIVAAAGAGARVVVFSTEGMSADNCDVPNTILLPELLFRHSFPGCRGLDFDPDRGPSPEAQAGIHNWVMEVWHQRRRPRPIETWLRDRLPLPLAMRLFRWAGLQPPLFHPTTADFWNFLSLTWSAPYRRFMRAFSLVTNSDGFVRLNVRGRERHGVIAARHFERECAALEELLHELRDPDTGRPVVRKVIATRRDPFDCPETAHGADLVVLWERDVRDRAVSPRHGPLGPAPYHRAGAHTPDGFLAARGPGIARGTFPVGSPLDVAPTVLDLCGVTTAALPGRSLAPAQRRHAA